MMEQTPETILDVTNKTTNKANKQNNETQFISFIQLNNSTFPKIADAVLSIWHARFSTRIPTQFTVMCSAKL